MISNYVIKTRTCIQLCFMQKIEKKRHSWGYIKVTQTRLHQEIQCFQAQLDIIFSSPNWSKKGKLILVQTSLLKLISSFKIEFIKNLTLFDSFNNTDYSISFVKDSRDTIQDKDVNKASSLSKSSVF